MVTYPLGQDDSEHEEGEQTERRQPALKNVWRPSVKRLLVLALGVRDGRLNCLEGRRRRLV